MRWETIDDRTHIYIEDGEDRVMVLRAIARASYEIAVPVGSGFMHYTPGGTLSDEECDSLVDVIAGVELHMDYVKGRQCKTYLIEEDGHFVLHNHSFERDRGKPDDMLGGAAMKLAALRSANMTTE